MHAPVAVKGVVSVLDSAVGRADNVDAVPLVLCGAMQHLAIPAVADDDAAAVIVLGRPPALINNGSGRQIGVARGDAVHQFDADAALDDDAPLPARHVGVFDGDIPGVHNVNAHAFAARTDQPGDRKST